MMKKITALLAFFCLLISVLNAQNYTLVENNFDRVQIRFTSAEISSYDIHTEQGWFSRVAMPSTTPSRVVGSPELPILTELMERNERVYGVFKWSSMEVGVGCGASEAWGEFTADFVDDYSDEANEISEAVLGF